MNSEKLFKTGVVEKGGDGKRYRVLAILPDGVSVAEWDDDSERKVLKSGEYEVWTPPKTVFNSYMKGVTWGKLKAAAEQELAKIMQNAKTERTKIAADASVKKTEAVADATKAAYLSGSPVYQSAATVTGADKEWADAEALAASILFN